MFKDYIITAKYYHLTYVIKYKVGLQYHDLVNYLMELFKTDISRKCNAQEERE
jgi:hypothetical protein